MDSSVTVETRPGYQVVTLSWTPEAPGFTISSFHSVADALQQADRADDVAATVFRSTSGCFCLGNDVEALLQQNDHDALAAAAFRFFGALAKSRKALIAAVDGAAAGVGVTMLLHFDAIFATPASTFSAPFVDWGLVPEAGATLLAPETMGRRATFALMCLGESLSAEEAAANGLVTRVVDTAALDHVATGAAIKLSKASPLALAATRSLLRGSQSGVLKRARTEMSAFRELLTEGATRRRLRVMGRALRRAFA